jgi:hypothetical protein
MPENEREPDVDDQLREELDFLVRTFRMFCEFTDNEVAAALLVLAATFSYGLDPLNVEIIKNGGSH